VDEVLGTHNLVAKHQHSASFYAPERVNGCEVPELVQSI